MAHAVEGYSRPNAGQTIQVKNQKKSTPASKPQTVKKNSSNVGGAIYTASRFEDVAKNKSTYTAKATYTNPVLAKKQSTIAQVAQSNKEAAKTTPNALSVAKNFFGGVVDAGVSTAVSLYNLGRHPVQTAKAVGTVIAHPVQTAEAIKEIAVELKDDFKEGNADVKAHMIGRAVGEIGLAIAGAKAVDIGAKALKTFKAAQATANGGKAGVVAEKLSEASKAADTIVKIEDEIGVLGKNTYKNIDTANDIVKETKASRILQNKAQGDAFEQLAKQELLETQDNVVEQITLKTESGVRTRLDLMGNDKSTGAIQVTEVKSSATAPLTKNQKQAFPEIEKSGATVVGKGKPPFVEGTQIPPTTVKIIRPEE